MKTFSILSGALALGLLAAGPAMAQTGPAKQKTQTESPATAGRTSSAYKQRTDGAGPPMVGPASGAYKQRTDGAGPPMVGPASGAYKQQ